MHDIEESLGDFKSKFDGGLEKFGFENKLNELERLRENSTADGFWDDNTKASKVMQDITSIQGQISPWQKIKKEIDDLTELIDIGDESIKQEILFQLQTLEKEFIKLKTTLAFRGPYDYGNAILSFYAGAGGTDAQDWTQMLLRMYKRYGEKEGYKVALLDESPGEEAGIKSATIELKGNLAYGKLKGENGVHRLVRLSPFNSDNLRQTSFAKVEVLPEIETPSQVPLEEKDLRIDVFRAGGHGGQSVNTTDSAVRITHLPTNITVSIQNERSQIQNKETAMTILRSKLVALQIEQHKENIAELKGSNQANEWGSQIRNYVLHPYKQVKDLRTKYESSDPDKVLDGDLAGFIEAFALENQQI